MNHDSSINFSELSKLYITYAKTIKAASSMRVEEGILNYFCTMIGKKIVSTLKTDDLEELYSKKVYDYKPHSIRLRIDALRALYKFAIQRGYLKNNIALQLKRPRAPTLPPKYVDPKLIDKVFKAMSPKIRIKFTVLYFTGMRPSEMLRLQAQDIDLENRSITVRYSKTKRFRFIPIHRELLPILQKVTEGKNKEDFLFSSRKGTVEKHQIYISQSLRRACKKAKVEGVTPYVFRHQFATMVYNKTKDLRGVQQLLGHTDIRTTTRYATALNEELRNAVETL